MKDIVKYFEFLHNNPPPPFNPQYAPKAKARYRQVTSSMEKDNFYESHTREQCKEEWAKRYSSLRNKLKMA